MDILVSNIVSVTTYTHKSGSLTENECTRVVLRTNLCNILILHPFIFCGIAAGSSKDLLSTIDFDGTEEDALFEDIGIKVESQDEVR